MFLEHENPAFLTSLVVLVINLYVILTTFIFLGVDIFWDSVGGDFSATVLPHMSIFGRVIMVGNLSKYNNIHSNATIPALDLSITLKELTIVGFNVYRQVKIILIS